MIGDDAIELGAREWTAVVGKLVDGPSAECVDPFTRRDGPGSRAQSFERLGARGDAVPSHLVLPRRAGTQQVHVVVDEAGDDRASPEIDAPRRCAGELRNLLIASDGDEPITANRDP